MSEPITSMPAAVDPQADDIAAIVQPAQTPKNRKITLQSLWNALLNLVGVNTSDNAPSTLILFKDRTTNLEKGRILYGAVGGGLMGFQFNGLDDDPGFGSSFPIFMVDGVGNANFGAVGLSISNNGSDPLKLLSSGDFNFETSTGKKLVINADGIFAVGDFTVSQNSIIPKVCTENGSENFSFNNDGHDEIAFDLFVEQPEVLVINLPVENTTPGQVLRYVFKQGTGDFGITGTILIGEAVPSVVPANTILAWQAIDRDGNFIRIQ